MKRFATPLKVGIVALVGITGIIYLTFSVKKGIRSAGDNYRVWAHFNDATGLAEKSRVMISGINAAQIEKIELEDLDSSPLWKRKAFKGAEFRCREIEIPVREGGTKSTLLEKLQYCMPCRKILVEDKVHYSCIKAKIHLLVKKEIALKIDATVSKKSSSIIGDFYLELTPGISSVRIKEGEQILNVIDTGGITGAMTRFEDLAYELKDFLSNDFKKISTNIKGITEGINHFIKGDDPDKKGLNSIVTALVTTIDKVNLILKANSEHIDSILKNTSRITGSFSASSDKTLRYVNTILANLQSSATHIRNITENVNDLIGKKDGKPGKSGNELKLTFEKIQQGLTKVNDSLQNVNEITQKINTGKGTLGKLVNDQNLINKFEEIVTDTGVFLKRVMRINTIIGYRAEYNILQASLKNYFSLRIQPKEDKYYLFEIIDDPRGKATTTQIITKTNDPSKPPITQEERTEISRSLKFTAMLAKRFYFLTGRFGIIENTGGLGLDIHFFKEALSIKTEIFDFDRGVNPRLKSLIAWEIFNNFYIHGGVDDILNKGQRDYFVGVGIKFSDADLKSIISLAAFFF